MTAEASRERVARAAHRVQAGPAALRGSVAYPLYVVALLTAIYGHSLLRAVVVVANPTVLAAALSSWPALAVGGVLVVLGLRAAHRAGRTRGPAVPPLAWVDLVVGTDVDRAEALRGWWWQSVTAVCGAGLILAATLGGASWTSGATGPGALVASLVLGPTVGFAVAALWLRGQAAQVRPLTDGSGSPWARALRRISLDELRAQAARASAAGARLATGNVRAAGLHLSSPVTTGRRLRLRPGRPAPTMVRRDLLGLRRVPETLTRGMALVALAGAGVGWAATLPGRSLALATLIALLAHLGCGALTEGLRLQADRGDDDLLGLPWAQEFAAHLVAPAVLTGVIAAGAGALAAPPGTRTAAAGTSLGLGAVAVGAHAWAAFRGLSPYPAYLPNGRILAVAWHLVPPAVTAVCGGYVAYLAPTNPGAALPWLVAAPVGVLLGARGAGRPHRRPR